MPRPKQTLKGKFVMFTGFRDQALVQALEKRGGIFISNDRKMLLCNLLVTADTPKAKKSTKTALAKKKGVTVVTVDKFKAKYISSKQNK